MGDTQSAQRAGKKDAAEDDESGKVNDDQTVQNTEDKPLRNNGQISEINGKADGSIAALNGHCEDKLSAEDNNVTETKTTLKEEETPLENVEISKKKLPDEVDMNEVEPVEIIEMEEKQNDINESFRKFFSNIGLKLTVKRGSGEKDETDVPKEGPNIPEEVKDNVEEAKSENEEQNVDLNAAQEANDYDSTTCPTLTDGTSENFLESAETKTTETKEEAESESADAGTTSPALSEDAHQDTIPEEEPRPKSPLNTNEIVVESPFKKFFTTGIFSSLKKKKNIAEDETMEKELVVMGENETAEIAEQALEEQQNKEEITLDTEAVTTAKGLGEAEILPVVSIQVKDEDKSPSMDTSDSIVNEAEILNSQEKEKVQASPLKKLMTGSSFKNLSKKQKGKKSSDAKISDSQQQVSDQLLSSTDSAEYQKEESPAQPSALATEDEDSAWVAFKKLVTPKKRKKSSMSNEQAQISGSVDEAKQSEEQQISDHSTDEGKKRKDSSVSWEAVLCGSGRRRSRKSSDSEEETPQTDGGDGKQNSGLKQGTESPLERSNEVQEIQEGSPPEGDGESTWKSFKKLVTPKTKTKDEDESKDTMPSDNRVTQADSTFSIKKLLPGRKKRKPAEKPDQVSSDEADKEVASDDEDSETPAVIPLSEFDAEETGVHTKTKIDVESYVSEEAVDEFQQESALSCDSLQIETQEVQDDEDALENEASKIPATVEEPDDLTELISKYQQLSDIPEEGILSETMATPASAIEEAARDDTITEDLIEITSEAITAPEPVDATVTDETEMISAVSQLSDSSKTSGNITPVPAEYNVKDTELLLGQVAENISSSPHTVAVTSEEPSSERIVSYISLQILETFEKEQPKILEMHKGSEETVINTDINTEPIDAINELAATVQTESVPDVNKAISIEIVSEVPTEEFDNAEITEDEVHEVSVIQGQENIKELEATVDSQQVAASVSGEKGELPQETSPEGEDVAQDEGSLVGEDQMEEDTSKTEAQEAESAPFVSNENKDGSMAHKAQSLTETRDQIIQNITEESRVEDQPSVVMDGLEVPTNVEKDAISSEDDTVQSLKKETPSLEDIPPAEAVTDESKHLTEVTVEPENTETQTEAPKTRHYEVTGVLEVEQKASVDTEEDNVQSLEEEVPSSEDIPPVESIDESKQTAEHFAEVADEPETKAPQPHISEVTEVSKVVQATLESQEQSVQKEMEFSEDVESAEPETDESKQTAEHLVEVTDEIQKKEPQVEVPEEMEVVQAAIFGSEEDSVQKEMQSSEDVRFPEPVTDESKQTAEHLAEVTDEPETKSPQPYISEVTEVSEVAQATLESDVESAQKEMQSSEDVWSPEPVTDESKQTAEHLTEVSDEIQNNEPQIEVPEEIEVVQAAIFCSEENRVQKEMQSSEDIQSAEPVTDESKQTAEHLTEVTDKPEAKEPQPLISEVTEVSEVAQATLESQASSVQKEMQFSEDIQSAEQATDESKQTAEYLAEVPDEPETKAPQSHISEVTEVSEVAQATLESQENSDQKEMQSSEDIQSVEPVTDESKQTAEHLVTVADEIQNKEPQVEVPEEVEVAQAATFDSEERSIQSLDKEVISEHISPAETDQHNETKMVPLPEDKVEALDDSKTEDVQEPSVVQTITVDSEADSPQVIEEKIISKDMVTVETVTDELRQETVELEKVEPVEAETSLPDIVPETDGKVFKSNVVAQSVEELSTQELETETLVEDIPKSDNDSVTDETEKTAVAQPDQDFEINKDQKTEIIPQGVQAEHEDRKAEALEETVTAAHVPSGAEVSHHQVLEETVFYKEMQAPCVDNTEVSGEPKHEEDLSIDQVSVEGEKAGELQSTEMNTAAAEHAVVMQVITCNLKDASAAIPDVLTEETPEIQEPSLQRSANEMEVNVPVETTTSLEKDNVNNTAEEGTVVVMMHAPSVEFDDNHRIQVQVMGVAIKSAENVVDTLIEVGVTEAKEVIDVCHETLEKVETLSASPAFEEQVNNEENNLTVQEVIQHVKETLPEEAPESPEPDLLEQEVMKQAAVGEIVQSGSSGLEDQKMMKDSTGAHIEEENEGHMIPAEQEVSEPQLQRSDLSLDISTLERKEDLEEAKSELQKSEVCVTTEAATASSEELSKKGDENTTEAQRPWSTQSQIVVPSNTELVAPQNTGMISSIGNVESPSSLSLEFKLNIQFGQSKAPASPPPPMEPMKQPDISTVAVQVVEAVEPTNVINAMQRVESKKQIELMEAAVQTTEITESGAVTSYQPKLQDGAVQKTDATQPVEQIEPIIPRNREAETAEPVEQITEPAEKTERAMLSYQPVLHDVGIQAMETIEPVEEIKSTQSIIPNIQAAETIEPVRQKEKRGVLISHPVVFEPFFEALVKGEKAEESIKQTEEENDDVWLDAEEDICTQEKTEVTRLEVQEPTEPQAESEQEEKEDLKPEFEMAPNSKTEDGESHQRVHKTGGTREIESEGEDFAVALECPETTISVPPAEWD